MNRQKWLVFGVVAALVGAAGALLHRLQSGYRLGEPGLKMIQRPVHDTEGRVVGTNTVDLPLSVLGYYSEPSPVTQPELDWLPKDTTYGRRRYISADRFAVDLSVVLMGTDRTSIHKPQICLVGQGWSIRKSELLTIPVQKPSPYELPVMRLTASKMRNLGGGERQEVSGIFVYWFVSENRITAKHGERMWWMATDLLASGVLPRWAYITYFSVCHPGQEEAAFARLREFIAASVPEFQLVAGTPETPPTAAAPLGGDAPHRSGQLVLRP